MQKSQSLFINVQCIPNVLVQQILYVIHRENIEKKSYELTIVTQEWSKILDRSSKKMELPIEK